MYLSLLVLLFAVSYGTARLMAKDIEDMESFLKVYSCNRNNNKHLHVFTHKTPKKTRPNRMRVRPARPSNKERRFDEDSEEVASRVLYIGGEKTASSVHFKMENFSWEQCPGTETDPVKIKSMKPVGETIVPGDVKVAFDVQLDVNVTAPVRAEVNAYKEVFGAYVKLPCYNDMGSCEYFDICSHSRYTNPCPADFQRDGIPCNCPFQMGTYKSDNLEVYAGITDPLDVPSWLTDGKYKIEVSYYNGNQRLACLKTSARVNQV